MKLLIKLEDIFKPATNKDIVQRNMDLYKSPMAGWAKSLELELKAGGINAEVNEDDLDTSADSHVGIDLDLGHMLASVAIDYPHDKKKEKAKFVDITLWLDVGSQFSESDYTLWDGQQQGKKGFPNVKSISAKILKIIRMKGILEEDIFKPASRGEVEKRKLSQFEKMDTSKFTTADEFEAALNKDMLHHIADIPIGLRSYPEDAFFASAFLYYFEDYPDESIIVVVSEHHTDKLIGVWVLESKPDDPMDDVIAYVQSQPVRSFIVKQIRNWWPKISGKQRRGYVEEDIFKPASRKEVKARRAEVDMRCENCGEILEPDKELSCEACGGIFCDNCALEFRNATLCNDCAEEIDTADNGEER